MVDSVGESSRTRELSALVEQTAYNLRPRKDDSVTMQRRSEFARWRELQNQRRIKLREAETLRQKELNEYVQRASRRIREIISRMPKHRDEEDEDLENRTEIINTDTSGVMGMEKWRPYFLPPDIGLFKTTLKGASWAVEELALQVAPSVVGLQSVTARRTDPFYCSGTIFESSGKTCLIVTVANLVKNCPDTDELAEGLEINLCLQNHQTCEGKLLYHDFYYNVCVIQIESPVHLPKQDFSSNIGAINFAESSRDVVALGRDKETHALVVNTGKVVPKSSNFDCEELLVSTCRISKADVGGPLMNFDGDLIGLNYYHHSETPFIPSFIVLKCLQQFKLFRKVVRPRHGLRVRTLSAEGCNEFEKMQTNLRGTTGVIIHKIEEQSSAKESGLNEGDIINQVNGVYFSNAAELGGILLDIGTTYMLDYQRVKLLDDSNKMCIKFGVRGCGRERTIVVDKPTSSGLNRWPFPKPIIVRKYFEGILEEEKWYAVES